MANVKRENRFSSKASTASWGFLVGFLWLATYVALDDLPTNTITEMIEHTLVPYGGMIAVLVVLHYGARQHEHVKVWAIVVILGMVALSLARNILHWEEVALEPLIVLAITIAFAVVTFIPSWGSMH